MSGKGAGAFLGGVLFGTAIGSILGILLAPQTGKDTRKLLKQRLDDIPIPDTSDSAQQQIEKLVQSARKSLDETIDKLNETIEANRVSSAPLEKNGQASVSPPASEI